MRCESEVNKKIEQIVLGGSKKLQVSHIIYISKNNLSINLIFFFKVISDFDRTISRYEYNNEQVMSSFCKYKKNITLCALLLNYKSISLILINFDFHKLITFYLL